MELLPDIEVIFEFDDVKKKFIYEGYRPAHLVKEGYLTTGVHHYYNVENIVLSGRGKGTITFITPEEYPSCMEIGKKITMQEGAKVVGYATVTHIFNAILDKTGRCE